jgi:hypothetical protein
MVHGEWGDAILGAPCLITFAYPSSEGVIVLSSSSGMMDLMDVPRLRFILLFSLHVPHPYRDFGWGFRHGHTPSLVHPPPLYPWSLFLFFIFLYTYLGGGGSYHLLAVAHLL